MLAIDAKDLRKTYRSGVEALCGLDLEVEKGELFSLLGPNGAGKTTLIRILSTELRATSGSVSILGHDLDREANKIRRRLSTVPQRAFPETMLKVWEHVYYYLVARGMTWKAAKAATKQITDDLKLSDKYNDRISHLSGGMKQRVLLAMALGGEYDLLYLDEPTTGLDVLVRRETWNLLARFKRTKTLLLTTHSMEEAEVLADRIGIVHGGRMMAVGTPAELRSRAPGSQKVMVDEAALPQETLERLGHLQRFAGQWAVYPHDDEAMSRVLALAVERKVDASVMQATLEDAFVHLVGDAYSLKAGELA